MAGGSGLINSDTIRSVRFLALFLLLVLPNNPGLESRALGAEEARELLDKARRIAFTLPAQGNPPVRDILLRKISVSQARAGYTSDALLTLAAVEDPNGEFKPSAYALIALMQARKGEGMDALRTALQIEVEPWRSLAIAQVAVAQARTGFVGGALQSAAEIRDSDQRDRVLIEIMGHATATRRLDGRREHREHDRGRRLDIEGS